MLIRLPFWEDSQLLRSTEFHIRGVASTHMGHDDTVRRVDVEGLRFGVIRATGRRIPHCTFARRSGLQAYTSEERHTMANTHSPDELGYGSCVEHISDHSICLALIETSLVSAGDDTARVLAAVLEK